MREMKVRAWDSTKQKMIYGQATQFDDMLGFRFEHFECDEPIYSWYTGLKDRNGKEAYHKDIILHDGWMYVVEWIQEEASYYLADYRYLNDPMNEEHIVASCIREGDIIGNVYENPNYLNPELLEKV